jgi:protein TonB
MARALDIKVTHGIGIVLAIGIHAGLAHALTVIEATAAKKKPSPMEVSFDVKVEPPPPPKVEEPPPPPPPDPEPEPVPEKKAVEKPKVVKTPEVVAKSEAPPPDDAPPPEPPAPGPPTPDGPPPEFVYTMPSGGTQGTMNVKAGTGPTGRLRGTKTGTGTGGGGGDPDSTGTGGPRVVSVAAVKSMPEVCSDTDFIDRLQKEYPETAKRDGIQGDVVLRLLIDESGKVAQTKVVKGPRRDLSDKAVQLARSKRLFCKSAIDTDGKAVAVWISYTFKFVLPED